jgi:hypothetical protein
VLYHANVKSCQEPDEIRASFSLLSPCSDTVFSAIPFWENFNGHSLRRII